MPGVERRHRSLGGAQQRRRPGDLQIGPGTEWHRYPGDGEKIGKSRSNWIYIICLYLFQINSICKTLECSMNCAQLCQPDEIFKRMWLLQKAKKSATHLGRGHILRSNNSDPLRRISYDPNSAVNYNVWKRRVWGPRQQWLSYTSRI